ncbi:MAG: hypothetical protein H7Y18_10505 [Clostridiaceae bacterium]|nr:hypothetical protein [Clostridiaceae bacterium]
MKFKYGGLLKLKNKYIVIIVVSIILIGLNIGLDIFIHSNTGRVIRTDLFLQGYFKEAFKTEIHENPITDSQYGKLYFCKSPTIGPDHYDIDYTSKYWGKFKYYYINHAGTGGG